MRRRPLWAAGLLGLALALTTTASSELYQWPLDLPRELSSSFGEYRAGRYHAGIDLRTNGVGRSVHAAADGVVSRVRCSPWGYGKAVYLTLRDGNTVVYAHLSDFAPFLRDYVRAAQHAGKDYTVDLYPEAGRFPVHRGDVIALSGQTGVGFPHLHYEIRDGAGRPIHPRTLGITWPDSTVPIIRSVLVMPRDPLSSVNGDLEPVVLTTKPMGRGRYTCEPVRASGAVGLGVRLVDPANQGANRLGVYLLRTVVDGQEAFCVRNDRLSYETIRNGAVAWHPFVQKDGFFLLQWRWPGNLSEPFNQVAEEGWIELSGNPRLAVVEAQDVAGNRAVVEVPIVPDEIDFLPGPTGEALGKGTVKIECTGNWITLTASFDHPEPELPGLTVEGDAMDEPRWFRRVDGRTFRAGYLPADHMSEIALCVEHPRISSNHYPVAVFHRGRAETRSVGNLTVQVGEASPYGTLFMHLDENSAPPEAGALRPLGACYRLWPKNSPIDAPLHIGFPLPSAVEHLKRVHIYRRGSSGWTREETSCRGNRLEVTTRELGDYMAMEDAVPPRVTKVSPADGASVGRRPEIQAAVEDSGSGIADIRVTANGHWLLTAYDPEAGCIAWERDEDLPSGQIALEIQVTDHAGNVTTVRREVQRNEAAAAS